MTRLPRWLLWPLLGALAGCTGQGRLIGGFFYEGEAPRTHLEQLKLQMEDGARVPFAEVFPGFAAHHGTFARRYPMDRMDDRDVLYPTLREVFDQYDANANRRLEEPELTVLYVVEAARGLGHPVAHLAIDEPVRAVEVPSAEIAGLLRFVDRTRGEMSVRARRLFSDLDNMIYENFREEGGKDDEGDGGGGATFM